jgi:hypothetical protein
VATGWWSAPATVLRDFEYLGVIARPLVKTHDSSLCNQHF